MIESIKVTGGYASKLPAIMDNTFKFTPGLNLCFAPNGCGKSTLLKIMAGYCACPQIGGWSNLKIDYGQMSFDLKDIYTDNFKYPDDIRINGCSADVKWDGTPTYFQNTNASDAPIYQFGKTGLDMGEEINELFVKPSDGQKRLDRISKMSQALLKPPKFTEGKFHSQKQKLFVEYVETLKRNGKMTLLMDEPDRSLSVENQILVWSMLPVLVERGFQIIVASHSLIPILRAPCEMNLIDMIKDYLTHSKLILQLYQEGKPYKEIMYVAMKLREEDAKKEKLVKPADKARRRRDDS